MFDLLGGWELNPQLFSHPNHTVNLCTGGQLYTTYIRFTSQFRRAPDVKTFNPQVIFHNSNTGYTVGQADIVLCRRQQCVSLNGRDIIFRVPAGLPCCNDVTTTYRSLVIYKLQR